MSIPSHWPRVIGITGLRGSGKSTFARALQDIGYSSGSFAAPMKEFCRMLFGWSEERVYGPSEERERPDPEWGGLTARHALQTLGTDWGRKMAHPDVWVRYALRTQTGFRIFEDVRFRNEADFIRSKGGIVIRVRRGVSDLPWWRLPFAHESERRVPFLPVDGEWDGDFMGRPSVDKVLIFLDSIIHSKKPLAKVLPFKGGAQDSEDSNDRKHRISR